ncbi:MAG TPA: hypothetical protein VHV83_08420, partial [Armatimonadota bacterium]|nr:hypothetical protein [Armatimonadota bacterium]
QPQEVLASYAERYFGLNGQLCNDWADWFLQWGEPLTVDIPKARREFDRLSANVTPSWRLAQWNARLCLYAAHWDVLRHNEWNNEKRSAAEQFNNELRHLYRDIWGLGLVRHVLSPRFFTPEWYNGWQDASRQAVEVGSEY